VREKQMKHHPKLKDVVVVAEKLFLLHLKTKGTDKFYCNYCCWY
jgi:hypothetical protein